MTRSLRSYRGLWQHRPVAGCPVDPVLSAAGPECHTEARMEELWRQLVSDRQQLGEHLLSETSSRKARASSWLRTSWSAWAHQRIFSLACVLHVQLPEQLWRTIRSPWHLPAYSVTCRVLLKLLDLYAGSNALGWRKMWLRTLRLWPSAFIWSYDRTLTRVRRHQAMHVAGEQPGPTQRTRDNEHGVAKHRLARG